MAVPTNRSNLEVPIGVYGISVHIGTALTTILHAEFSMKVYDEHLSSVMSEPEQNVLSEM